MGMHRIILCLTVSGLSFSYQPLLACAEPFAEPRQCCTPLEKIQTHLSRYTLYISQDAERLARQALFDAQVLLELHDPQMQNTRALWEQVAAAHAQLSQFSQAEKLYTRLYAKEARFAYVLPLADLALAQQHPAAARQWLLLAEQGYSATSFPPRLPYALWSAGLLSQAEPRFQYLFSEQGVSLRKAQDPVLLDTWRLAYAALLLSRADTASRAERSARAEAQLNAISQWSTVPQALLADVWMDLERYERAAPLFQALYQASPERLDYGLAWANVLTLMNDPLAKTLYPAIFQQAQQKTGVTDTTWRALMSGLKASQADAQAELAFLRIQDKRSQDWLEGAFLAELRGDDATMRLRYQRVLETLPEGSEANDARMLQRVQAEWALFLAGRRQTETGRDFLQLQQEMAQRLQEWQPLLWGTIEGRLLWSRLALALDTPTLRETLAGAIPEMQRATDLNPEQKRELALNQALLSLRQDHLLAAALDYEQLYQRWQQTPEPWPTAFMLSLARGLGEVGKLQAAEQLWSALQQQPEARYQAEAWAFERLLIQAKAYPQWRVRDAVKARMAAQDRSQSLSPNTQLMRAQLALQLMDYTQARQDFEAVLKRWPGERLALQGLALSLKGQQRYAQAHERFTALQTWFLPEDAPYDDTALRLAEIERAWQDPVQALQRLERLSAKKPEAALLAESIAQTQWIDTETGFVYQGLAGWQQQDLFIGERYVSLGVTHLSQKLGHRLPVTSARSHQPPFQQELGLDLTHYQPLGASSWFPFLRGKAYTRSLWRREFEEGPLHAWLSPTLAYQWGLPDPLSIGSNQHGRMQLEAGLQMDPRQALIASGTLAVGEAELFLGSFYNYGGDLRWRWREAWHSTQGVWGVDAVTGLDNYLVLDGDNQTQDLFRQRNAVNLVYHDQIFDYQGRLELAPIYGTLADLYLGTQQRLDYRFSADWTGVLRAEWHHYQQPVQRLQNRWQAGVGVRYALPSLGMGPLSLGVTLEMLHFYQSDQPPVPQLSIQWETRQ